MPDDDIYEIMAPPEIIQEVPWKPPPSVDRPKPCPKCNYDLRGLEIERCPECGTFYQDALLEKRVKSSNAVFDFTAYRWIAYGVIPMMLWAPLAVIAAILFKMQGYVLASLLGTALAVILTVYVTKQALEENRWEDGFIPIVATFLVTGFLNFTIIRLILSML